MRSIKRRHMGRCSVPGCVPLVRSSTLKLSCFMPSVTPSLLFRWFIPATLSPNLCVSVPAALLHLSPYNKPSLRESGLFVVRDHAAVLSPVGDVRLFLGEGVLGIMAVTRSIFSLLLVQTLNMVLRRGLAQTVNKLCWYDQVVPVDEKWLVTNP
jgi:hypothetical protein